jgi:hypothetical protein
MQLFGNGHNVAELPEFEWRQHHLFSPSPTKRDPDLPVIPTEVAETGERAVSEGNNASRRCPVSN